MRFSSARTAITMYLTHQHLKPGFEAADLVTMFLEERIRSQGGRVGARKRAFMSGKKDSFHSLSATGANSNVGSDTRFRTWKGLELGDICRGLNERTIGKPAYTWALYAYGGEDSIDTLNGIRRQSLLIGHMLAEFREAGGKLNAKNIRKMGALAAAALQDYKVRDCTGRAKYKPAEICRKVGVSHSNWASHWQPKFERLQEILNQLAAKALAPVSARLAEIADYEDEEAVLALS